MISFVEGGYCYKSARGERCFAKSMSDDDEEAVRDARTVANTSTAANPYPHCTASPPLACPPPGLPPPHVTQVEERVLRTCRVITAKMPDELQASAFEVRHPPFPSPVSLLPPRAR